MSEAAPQPAPAPFRARLIEGRVDHALIRLTWPMLGGLTALITQPLIDSYFLGQLGLRELAAIQLVLPVTLLGLSIIFGLGVGTTAILAQHIGAGQWTKVRSIVSQAHLLTILVMLGFSVLGLVFLEEIFTAFGAGPDLMGLIKAYMTVWLGGTILLALPMTGNACMRANGEVKMSSLVLVVIAVGKLILTPWLVFGGLGVPGLGMAGAAWASLGAHLLASLLALYLLGPVNRMFDLSWPRWAVVRPIWARLLKVGAPTALTNTITPLSMLIVNTILLRHGPATLAGFGVGNRLEALAMMMAFALASSVVPFLGQNYAAGRTDRMAQAMRLALGFTLAYGLVLALVLAPSAAHIGGAFSDDPAAIAAARAYLLAIPFSYGVYGAMIIIGMAFISLGNAAPNLIFVSVRLFLIYVPGALLGNALYGYHGILAAVAASNVIAGLLSLYWYRRYFPKP